MHPRVASRCGRRYTLMMRILGLDYGHVRIGVALGDTETKIASPLMVVDHESVEDALDRLVSLAKTEGVTRFVIGVPAPLFDQSRETDQAREIRDFAGRLRAQGVEVVEENETWTTKLAERQTRELGQKGKRDDLAAAAILQTYLDKRVEGRK